MTSKVVETNLAAGILHNDSWVESWKVGDTGFHHEIPDPFLDKYEQEMFEGKTKSIFLPLCGKTLDILWLYRKGHTVAGVEIAEQAIREFFEEHNIEKDIETVVNVGKMYKSKDGRIKLYAADVFDMSPTLCGTFDIIWDSKSLVAINLADHQLYRDTMLGLMKPDGKCYLNTLEYDPAVWAGPPHTTTEKTVQDLYGGKCSIEIVEEDGGDKPVVLTENIIGNEDADKLFSGVGPALSSSSYLYTRWYKIMFK